MQVVLKWYYFFKKVMINCTGITKKLPEISESFLVINLLHLHLDYFPVAEGYKQGLSKRNSISKALQCMGIPKAEGKMKNEESVWKDREREYIKSLCEERGIEIEQLNENRDNYTLPEYREIMQKVDRLKLMH